VNPPTTLTDALRHWPLGVAWTSFWAVFIAVLAVPACVVVFALRQLLLSRAPGVSSVVGGRALEAMLLSFPPTLLLTWGFAGGGPDPFDWGEAAWVFPTTLLSCSGAVLLPRMLIPGLRGSLSVDAG
jgi:hypothetical protein